jgi:CheY-like chemotaxis protein
MIVDLRPAIATPVLIGDCDASRRAIVSTIVRKREPHAAIVEAATGEELANLILRYRPNLGFISVQMDDISGPEAVALARKSGGVVSSLVLITSHFLPRWREVAQALEAYEVLKTPLDPDHISRLLHANERRLTPTSILLAATPHGRGLIHRVLNRSGFAVNIDEAENGRHALKLLSRGAYEIAFVDTALNDIDGLEIACQLQSSNCSTKLVLMTQGDADKITQAARYFGVSFVLRMPFYPRDVDLLLHNALNLRRPYLLNSLTAPPAPTALVSIKSVQSRCAAI